MAFFLITYITTVVPVGKCNDKIMPLSKEDIVYIPDQTLFATCDLAMFIYAKSNGCLFNSFIDLSFVSSDYPVLKVFNSIVLLNICKKKILYDYPGIIYGKLLFQIHDIHFVGRKLVTDLFYTI